VVTLTRRRRHSVQPVLVLRWERRVLMVRCRVPGVASGSWEAGDPFIWRDESQVQLAGGWCAAQPRPLNTKVQERGTLEKANFNENERRTGTGTGKLNEPRSIPVAVGGDDGQAHFTPARFRLTAPAQLPVFIFRWAPTLTRTHLVPRAHGSIGPLLGMVRLNTRSYPSRLHPSVSATLELR
jgi:hypothetical protein